MMINILFALLALSLLAVGAVSISLKGTLLDTRASGSALKDSSENLALGHPFNSTSAPPVIIATSSVPPTKESPPKEMVPSSIAQQMTEIIKSPLGDAPASDTLSPPPASKSQGSLYTAAEKARAALVNIRCTSDSQVVPGATGSGVIVDPKGIIVTNAHVAQYFLIEQMMPRTSCYIRTGTPAKAAYDAELMFISPQWLGRNATSFSNSFPAVNGAFDYAFLGITKSLTNDPLPEAFPYIPLASDEALLGEDVVATGYAAEFLDETQIDSALSPTSAFGKVVLLSSFSESHPDLLEIGSSAAAQRGSSGGAIVNASGDLRGMLTIASALATSTEREFAGISADYIRRTYKKEEGKSLDVLLDANPMASISAFKWRAEELAEPLMHSLHNPDPWDIYPW